MLDPSKVEVRAFLNGEVRELGWAGIPDSCPAEFRERIIQSRAKKLNAVLADTPLSVSEQAERRLRLATLETL